MEIGLQILIDSVSELITYLLDRKHYKERSLLALKITILIVVSIVIILLVSFVVLVVIDIVRLR